MSSIGIKLWKHQARAISETRKRISQGGKRILLVSPTGSGKTTMAVEMIHGCLAKGNRALFLAHRRELINQCAARLRQYGIEPGIICAGVKADPSRKVQVASIQTLARRKHEEAALVIVDESHRSTSKQTQSILTKFSKSTVFIGLTATPWRLDGKWLGEFWQETVVAAMPSELIEAGKIMEPRMFAPPLKGLADVKKRRGDYEEAGLAMLMNTKEINGSVINSWEKYASDRLTIAFAVNVKHAKDLAAQFQARGYRADYISGALGLHQRTDRLNRFRKGLLQVLINVGILTEGYDLPALGCAILARPTQSRVLYLQQVGRVLRVQPGKPSPIVLDHGNLYAEHGWPTQDRDYSLAASKQANTHKQAARSKHKKTSIVCPHCMFVAPMGVRTCPNCLGGLVSHQLVVENQEKLEELGFGLPDLSCLACGGNLELKWMRDTVASYLTKCTICDAESWGNRPIRGKEATPSVKKSEWHRLEQIRKRYGFAKGWTSHKYREIFGVWPKGVRS